MKPTPVLFVIKLRRAQKMCRIKEIFSSIYGTCKWLQHVTFINNGHVVTISCLLIFTNVLFCFNYALVRTSVVYVFLLYASE